MAEVKFNKAGKADLPPCPICGNNIHTKIGCQRQNNGVIGPGYKSWVTSFHFFCKVHGSMFHDVRENAPQDPDKYHD